MPNDRTSHTCNNSSFAIPQLAHQPVCGQEFSTNIQMTSTAVLLVVYGRISCTMIQKYRVWEIHLRDSGGLWCSSSSVFVIGYGL